MSIHRSASSRDSYPNDTALFGAAASASRGGARRLRVEIDDRSKGRGFRQSLTAGADALRGCHHRGTSPGQDRVEGRVLGLEDRGRRKGDRVESVGLRRFRLALGDAEVVPRLRAVEALTHALAVPIPISLD